MAASAGRLAAWLQRPTWLYSIIRPVPQLMLTPAHSASRAR
jgi:hypothetical protein